MCGIAGYFNRNNRPIDKEILMTMTRTLSHRGPDDEGVWYQGAIGLGHRRLSIRDLSKAGHQPLLDAKGQIAVSYNGEIYNYHELRQELESKHQVVFSSNCDTEIIPYGYLAWGNELFDRLEGMFAIALWDKRSQTLVLARDAIGIKPLYYSLSKDRVFFGSEIKSLLKHPDFDRSIDKEALHTYLSLGYSGPDQSLVQGCKQIPPGSYLEITSTESTSNKFWSPVRDPQIFDEDQALEAFTETWFEVITDIIQSDVPVAVMQSAGIDSSLVSLQLQELSRYSDIVAFTAKFDLADFDESATVAKISGLPLVEVEVDTHYSAEALFRNIVYYSDGQLADSSMYGVYLLAQAVRGHAKVALSGDGADEFYGGYSTYKASRVAAVLKQVFPRKIASFLADTSWRLKGGGGSQRLSRYEVFARFLDGIATANMAPHSQWRRLVRSTDLESLYGPEMREMLQVDPTTKYSRSCEVGGPSLVDACMLADQSYYLPSDMLIKVDRMSMAHGLEVRVPFLDRRIMELAGKMDLSLLTPFFGADKKILRQVYLALGGPGDIAARRKTGFNVPIAQMLRTSLKSMGDRLLIDEIERFADLFSAVGVKKLWRDHQSGKADHSYGLWALLTFTMWQSEFIESS